METFLGPFFGGGGPSCCFGWRGGLRNWELSHGSWWQVVHGSWLQSQNAELSSLLASSSVVLASQKCLQSQGIGGVLVAKLSTVVAFGFACCPRISKGLHICCCLLFFLELRCSWALFRLFFSPLFPPSRLRGTPSLARGCMNTLRLTLEDTPHFKTRWIAWPAQDPHSLPFKQTLRSRARSAAC